MFTTQIRTKKSQVVEYNIIQMLTQNLVEVDSVPHGPTDTANFNQVLSKHLDDIVFYNLTFFGANMSWEQSNGKNCEGFLKKQYFVSKNREKTRFS
jgi:hypothetical protein